VSHSALQHPYPLKIQRGRRVILGLVRCAARAARASKRVCSAAPCCWRCLGASWLRRRCVSPSCRLLFSASRQVCFRRAQSARARPAARRAGATSPPARSRRLVSASAVPPVVAAAAAPPQPAAPAPAPPRAARKPLHVRINDEWYDLSGWRLAHPGACLPRPRARPRRGCSSTRGVRCHTSRHLPSRLSRRAARSRRRRHLRSLAAHGAAPLCAYTRWLAASSRSHVRAPALAWPCA